MPMRATLQRGQWQVGCEGQEGKFDRENEAQQAERRGGPSQVLCMLTLAASLEGLFAYLLHLWNSL